MVILKKLKQYFNIKNITLKGVGTEINIKGKGDNLFDDSDLNIAVDGKVDLEAIEKSFPFKKSMNLAGAGERDRVVPN